MNNEYVLNENFEFNNIMDWITMNFWKKFWVVETEKHKIHIKISNIQIKNTNYDVNT